MEFGLNLRNFMADPKRPMHDQIEETAELLSLGEELGFWGAYAPEHWVSTRPVGLPHAFAGAARCRRVQDQTDNRRTPNAPPQPRRHRGADHSVGPDFQRAVHPWPGLGYREKELEIVGSNRSERVGRLEESIELMKMLWSGEEVTYRGRYFRATGAQMGIRPVHSPRPPIWLACQGRRAASRAARIADACLVGPYVSWADHESLATIYWEELDKLENSGEGFYAAHRCISFASDRESAIRAAKETAEATAAVYGGWGMQERTARRPGPGQAAQP